MKTTSESAAGWRAFGWFALGLAALLAWMFRQSFAEGWVHFSNDQPLAAIAELGRSGATGVAAQWFDLRWLGEAGLGGFSPWGAGVLLLDPVLFAKFSPAACLLMLGLCAWIAFRWMGLGAWGAALAALAAVLSAGNFSAACWGVGQKSMMAGYLFIAFGLAAGGTAEGWSRTVGRLVLAGVCLGMALNEGIDVAALLSPFLAALVLVREWRAGGPTVARIGRAAGKIVLVAVCSALVALHTLSVLSGTQVKGVAGMEQAPESKEQRWDWATQWSMPKGETLGMIVPGLFGYRMDTPDGGAYWGAVGRTPGWEQHKQGMPRFIGGGAYLGVLVVLGSVLAAVGAWRRSEGDPAIQSAPLVYSAAESAMIRFWVVSGLIALALAWGRHAPFYSLFYELPYMSTIRNPIKFLHYAAIAAPVLFGYALLGAQRLLDRPPAAASGAGAGMAGILRQWLGGREVAEEGSGMRVARLRWLLFCAGGIALLVFLGAGDLREHIRNEGFGEGAADMAAHVQDSLLRFVALLAAGLALAVTFAAGHWRGARGAAFWPVLGALLLVDMVPPNLPWIRYFNYGERYASNAVLERLREESPQSRTTILARQVPLYGVEWHQHHFLWFGIPCLDPIQMPRIPADYAAFMGAFQANPGRLWQVTSTRFLLGGGNQMLDQLNQLVDAAGKPFRETMRFGGRQAPDGRVEIVTGSGDLALYEYTRALPRVRLYEHWETLESGRVLPRLADPELDPARTVLVDGGTPVTTPAVPATNAAVASAATVVRWTPVEMDFQVEAKRPSILLVADRFHPGWRATVDGTESPVLRCNGVMRGVALSAGEHAVRFRFAPAFGLVGLNLAAFVVLVAVGGCLMARPRPSRGGRAG